MMSRPRKLLALVPVVAAFLFSDKTLASFGVMLVGGMILWIPYWLAWWLSDGFSIFSGPGSFETDGTGFHHDSSAQRLGDGMYNQSTGYRTGPQGFGFYSGSTRLDN